MRWRDGLVFGVLLLAGAAAAALLERLPRPRVTPALRRGLLARAPSGRAAAAVVFVVVKGGGLGRGRKRRRPARLDELELPLRLVAPGVARSSAATSSSGTGAGSFHLANLRFRSSFLDFTIEPHNLPLQFLAEAGIVGLVLLLLSAASLLRGSLRRHGHELALALVLPAYLLHSLVDIDWDFVAVSALAFLVAGALVGRPPRAPGVAVPAARRGRRRAARVRRAAPALARPALVGRRRRSALSPQQAITLAKRARSVDPLLVEPLLDARLRVGHLEPAARRARRTTRRRCAPSRRTRDTLLAAGLFELAHGCPRHAYAYLEPFTELDPKARAGERRRRLPASAAAREHGQADLLARYEAPSTIASLPPCSADGRMPSSGPTTCTCRSWARRTPSACEAALVHHDGRRVVLARRVALAANRVAEA